MAKQRTSRGPNLAPLKNLMEAQRFCDQGHSEEGAYLLSQAVGASETLPRLRENLKSAFDSGKPLSDIVIHLALVETRKKR